MGGDTFSSRDVDECLVVHLVCCNGDTRGSLPVFRWDSKALVSARNVIVHFDSVDTAGLCLLDNLFCIRRGQRVSGDAHLIQPGSVGLLSLKRSKCRQKRGNGEE